MIYITGDTHGTIDFSKLNYFKNKYVSKKDILIILGDAGIVWDKETLSSTISKYEMLGLTIIFIDGNHENFNLLNKFPLVNKYGAKMHLISNKIYHVLRGEILTINHHRFLCIGGANSIDRKNRVLGQSYWIEEEITDKDIDNAIKNLEKVDYQVDYVLTHCVDSKTLNRAFGYQRDGSSDKLSFIDHLVEYKYWYFGHYHFDYQVNDKKRCFYNDVLEINELYEGNSKKVFNSYLYTIENYRNSSVVSNAPYLYSKMTYNTKITEEDLPEWYVYGRYHKRFGYLSARGIKKIKYFPNMWINHYLRDDDLVVVYLDDSRVHVEGGNIVTFIYAIEKYNNLDLTYLKLKINFKANFYNFYHRDDYDFEEVDNAFKEVTNHLKIEEVIWKLVNKLDEEEKILYKSMELVMDTYLSDKIFDEKTKYYLRPINELYEELIEEIKIIKEREKWRYAY